MWPSGHLAFAYVIYRAGGRFSLRTVPTGQQTLVLGFGGLFPDLIDKPFSWFIPLLPHGHSLAHSLLTYGVVTAVLLTVAQRWVSREYSVPFLIGYGSHILGDAIYTVVTEPIEHLSFLDWPIPPHPPALAETSIIAIYGILQAQIIELLNGGFDDHWFLAVQLGLDVLLGRRFSGPD